MGRGNSRVGALLALVALSDVLIFGQAPGLNLFLFAISVTAAILFFAAKRLTPSAAALWFCLSALASAPLLEAPSLMGATISLSAVMVVALVGARLLPQRLTGLPQALFRFAVAVPLRLPMDCRKHLRSPTKRLSLTGFSRGLSLWIAPLILASIFLILFAIANPLIEEMLTDLNPVFLLQLMSIRRTGYWLLVAAIVWPMLRPRLKRRAARRALEEPVQEEKENSLLSHASLLRSLLIFNALFAVESLLDLVYLWGGLDLPNGMSHAEYAHRGAYPLIATALLAAVFVLVTMRRNGPGDKGMLLRSLVYAWIGQNILLCLSAILRLDLYVETYSLTELRVAAGIWMGLVASGLALILLRIVFRRSNEWLVAMNVAALAIVLYIGALIDFPAVIANFNVTHSQEISHEGVPLDLRYLSSLGPSAVPALDFYLASPPSYPMDKMLEARRIRDSLAFDVEHRQADWRSWTYRAERLDAYLGSPTTIAR
jgi:hypothetical protein